jgi:osmoprotectant transport system ATP-binding protein
VVDPEQRPQGWLAVGRLPETALDGEITPDLLNLGGTLAKESGTLREALDAALSSPSGRGVIVHDDETFAGTVSASQVLARIEERAAGVRRDAVQAAAAELNRAGGGAE